MGKGGWNGGKGKPWTIQERQRAIEMYRAGVSLDEMSRVLGRTKRAINGVMITSGTHRPKEEPPPCRRESEQSITWAEWRKQKHNGDVPKDTVEVEYKPDLHDPWDDDRPLGEIR